MRFIHTADWRIGMRAEELGAAAAPVRDARLRTAENVCALAAREQADFLLIAGDTFDSHPSGAVAVERVVATLASLPCPVYVLPGDRDPAQPGGVWEHPAWRTAPNVTLLLDPTPVPLAGGVLLPCPHSGPGARHDSTAWIPTREDPDEIRIVAAHGNAGPFTAEDAGCFIPPEVAERTGADYVALGHCRSTALFGARGIARMAYSGTPESTGFGDLDSGNALLVSVPAPGAAPGIASRSVGQLRWCRLGFDENVTAPGRFAELAHTLQRMPDPARTLVEVVVNGPLMEHEQEEMTRIERICARFLYARIERAGPRAERGEKIPAARLPPGLATDAGGRGKSLLGGAAESSTLTRGLLALQVLAHKAG